MFACYHHITLHDISDVTAQLGLDTLAYIGMANVVMSPDHRLHYV